MGVQGKKVPEGGGKTKGHCQKTGPINPLPKQAKGQKQNVFIKEGLWLKWQRGGGCQSFLLLAPTVGPESVKPD